MSTVDEFPVPDKYPESILKACKLIDEKIERLGGVMNYIAYIKAEQEMEQIIEREI